LGEQGTATETFDAGVVEQAATTAANKATPRLHKRVRAITNSFIRP
jgi:hypothetical protein